MSVAQSYLNSPTVKKVNRHSSSVGPMTKLMSLTDPERGWLLVSRFPWESAVKQLKVMSNKFLSFKDDDD